MPADYRPEFGPSLATAIAAGIRDLLSTKHLYQSVTVQDEFIATIAAEKVQRQPRVMAGPTIGSPPRQQSYEAEGRRICAQKWLPSNRHHPVGVARSLAVAPDWVEFSLPTINTQCEVCDARWPFNPIAATSEEGRNSTSEQWFFFGYECQNCKAEPVRFLVRRTGMKLTLCGRDPIESVDIPKVIPKTASKHYRGAVVAHQSGQTLAGIFLLRVCIEQYWRGLPAVMQAVAGITRPTGDELGAAYKATLPADFKDRFPTLAETYEILSVAMHTADPNVTTFEEAIKNIERHFDAKRVFRLA